MARYEHKCPKCGSFTVLRSMEEVLAELQSGSGMTPQPCPSCGHKSPDVFSGVSEVIVPARWGYEKAGIHEVLGD